MQFSVLDSEQLLALNELYFKFELKKNFQKDLKYDLNTAIPTTGYLLYKFCVKIEDVPVILLRLLLWRIKMVLFLGLKI